MVQHACLCPVVSDSLRPSGLEPTALLCPWDFPGENTGVVAISFSIRCSMDFRLITVINIPHQALLIESGETITSEQHPHSYAVLV